MLRVLGHLVLTVSVMASCGINARAQEAPEAQYKAILKAFDTAQQDYTKRMEKADGLAAQARIFREESPHPRFAAQLLELARKHPKHAVSYDCLTWILQHSECSQAAEKPYSQTIDLLAADYADHAGNDKLFERLVVSPFFASGKLLQAIAEKHPNDAIRGRARFHWGLFLKNYCDTTQQLHERPEWAKNVELFVGPDIFAQMKNADTSRLRRQAEDVFAKVQKDYAPVIYKKFGAHAIITLGKAAEGELFELRHLAIGKTAPDIEGDDTAGEKLKLSDYRGKVVVLVFWGTWCSHCMALLPQERALAKRYADKPFAIVGVNSDKDRAKLKPVLAKQGITWRSFWDGGSADGPVATRWNVQGWPGIYVLDARGVIRYKQVRDELLDEAVAKLMTETSPQN